MSTYAREKNKENNYRDWDDEEPKKQEQRTLDNWDKEEKDEG